MSDDGDNTVCAATTFPLAVTAWQTFSTDHPVASTVGTLLAALWITYFVVIRPWQTSHMSYNLGLLWEYLILPSVPTLTIDHDLPASVTDDDGVTTDSAPAGSRSLQGDDDHHDNTKRTIHCYDPSTQQFLGTCPAMTPADVHAVCRRAHAAQHSSWRHTTFRQRRRVLRTIQRYMVDHTEEICRVSARDSGKPAVDACLGEVLTTAEKIRTVCASGEVWLRPGVRHTGPMMLHKRAAVEYVPLGVVAAIAPWNYPFHNFMNHIVSGLFAGNAVVGKVSEHTSWSAVCYYEKIVKAALVANGHSPDLVQTVTGFGEAGHALVTDPLVDKVIFTGSPAIGKKVMRAASDSLKPVILELGGKDAMVIVDDCVLKDVVPWVLRGCYQNGGQNCVGVERVLVYESLYDDFLKAVLPRVKALRQGAPIAQSTTKATTTTSSSSTSHSSNDANIDVGALVMEAQLAHIQALVDDAIAHGAKLLTGGRRNESLPHGQFYQPTILADVTPAMRIFREEVFGPVMTVVKVPDNDDAAAIRLVNDSDFGLSSSVYSGNAARGLAVARQIRSGMCCVNDFGSNYLVQSLPFGGVKDSGFGRFAGVEGLRALCLERSILTDRIPGVKTSIPPPIDYPIDKEKGLPFCAALIQLFYNESWVQKIKGIVGLIKYG